MSQNSYTVDSIKALTDREHVRLKPSMYIGDTLQHGINQLVYEIIDNSIDEFLAGFGNKINVHIYKDCSVRVQDFGRGVPVGLTKDANGIEINSITLIFSKLMSGGKYQQDENGNNPYQYSAGQFGIGSGCCNFCSEFFEVTVSRDGKIWRQRFEQGIPVTEVEVIGVTEKDDTGKEITGTEIYYKPDKEIFKQTLKPSNDVRNRLQELAALNSGLTINFINDLSNIKETFYYNNGITSYLAEIVKSKKLLFDTPIYINGDFGTGKNLIKCEFAFIVDNEAESSSTIRSFTNNINTYTGGTHVNATKLALKNVLNAVGIKNKLFKDDLDIKYYLDGLYLIINLKMSNPSFEGQTKIKLNSVEVEPAITAVINDFFKKKLKDDEFKHIIDKILNHAIQVKEADEAARKARLEKRITNKVTKKSLLPVQLSDCINAGTDEYSELLLVEGQSAAGCVISSTFIHLADNRDVQIVDLVKEFNEGKKNYVFCRDENNNIRVRPIVNVIRTKFVKKVYQITLDNGFTVATTPEHLIMMRDGTYKEMQNLQIGDSLMPLYISYKLRRREWFGDYYTPYVYVNSEYQKIAQIVADDYIHFKPTNQKYDLHHRDYNPCNNNPENLVYLTPQEHSAIHAQAQKYWEDPKFKKMISDKSKENWQDPEYREKMDFVFHAETNPLVIAHRKRMEKDEEYKQEVVTRFMRYREENPDWKEHLSEKMDEFYDVNTEEGREHRKKASDRSKEQWNDEELRKWRAEETKRQIQQQKLDGTIEQVRQKAKQTREANAVFNGVQIFKQMIADNAVIDKPTYMQYREQYMINNNLTNNAVPVWNYMRLKINFNARKDDVEKIVREYIENYNHKVIKIEEIEYNDWVYDLEIQDYHNFAISAGIFIHNSTISGRISSKVQAVLPLRGKVLNVEKASWEQIVNSPSIQRIIQSLGTGFGKTFDIDKLRYDKIIILSDADSDGLHIKSLLITLMHKFMRPLITEGHLYASVPPLYKVTYNKNQSVYLQDDKALQQWRNKHSNINYEISRFKGLGEMDPEQLQETVLDPSKRTLKRINISDALDAEQILNICMGTDAAVRRKFIEENAYLLNEED